MAEHDGADGVVCVDWQVEDLLYLNFGMPFGTSRRTEMHW